MTLNFLETDYSIKKLKFSENVSKFSKKINICRNIIARQEACLLNCQYFVLHHCLA
jgi:hypothetical protein